MAGWSTSDIPDQHGRTAVVTGANSGIGLVTARELARKGARVVLACRSESRGREAESVVRAEVPGADVEFRPLDLAHLTSVRDFAASYPYDRLDLLINNAGVMALPHSVTADGFETQFGINHLGHFALTGLLLPKLLGTPDARVVSLSSFMHAMANIDIGDLNSERRYSPWTAYSRSKTANLLFVHELARRLRAAGSDVVAAAAHPGYANTNLQAAGARMAGQKTKERFMQTGNRIFAQSAASGALPTLYAATAPDVRPDSFTGPRILGWRGAPAPSWRLSWSTNDVAGERLWVASEQLTGVTYEGLKS
ncbi:oxidoreductase [Streptomyces sp. NPDC056437]|uniref:oxidoreductase n=1 Tax=Streptomyces sp. NPDC056437 TaxID=3345816 RepID=UPI0036BA3368